MSAPATQKISTVFLTGATGYIGGTVGEKLRAAGYKVIGLARTAEKAELLKQRGFEAVVGSLDDTQLLIDTSKRADAVINTADSDHAAAIDAFIKALEHTGKPFIHTSGSSVIADDVRDETVSDNIYTEDTFYTPIPAKVARAAIDRKIREAGINRGIRTVVICPTMIYGRGKGIHQDSVQIPKLAELSKAKGAGLYIGKGANIWSNVYIDDVADLYVLALERAPSASFFFVENGEKTLKEVAEVVSRSLGLGGKTESWNADEAIKAHGGWAQSAMASNSRVRAVNARRTLQWSPKGPTLEDAVEKNL